MVPSFAREVLRSGSSGSGLTALASHDSGDTDHVPCSGWLVQKPKPYASRTHDQWFLWERVLASCPALFPGCICSTMEKLVPTTGGLSCHACARPCS